MWNEKNIAEYLGCEVKLKFNSDKISIDSRKIEKGDIYLGLKGEVHNGNKFAEDALKKGAVAVIIDDENYAHLEKTILVADSLKALQRLAYKKRRNSKAKFIGVTGSVGKTTAKELLAKILSSYYRVHWTQGNLNNHIGLPLTIVNMPENTQYAVLEMGMNHAGEISDLCRIAHPHIAGITWVSEAHIENFSDGLEGIARAKAEILEFLVPDGCGVIPADNQFYEMLTEIAEENGISDLLSFGKVACECSDEGDFITANIVDQIVNIPKNLCEYFVENNILFALTIAAYIGLDLEDAIEAIKELKPVKGRGAEIQLKNGAVVIDDSYNASPESMKKALANLSKKQGYTRKIAILGDMKELGKHSKEYHESLAEHLKNIDFLITCGADMKYLSTKAKGKIKEIKHFKDYQECLGEINNILKKGDIALIKGSHSSNMYKLVEALG
ncbi:MAG: UDP-N-acetylmuramoyl-tripeptide--D-alanyl-D-alanine ligase [Rickettsiales bacterium]|nr:UDP-N-acetylmuramoyl-tripeptide--D-alanyl-D-alanine ligase [Rickettsiales bacterium]